VSGAVGGVSWSVRSLLKASPFSQNIVFFIANIVVFIANIVDCVYSTLVFILHDCAEICATFFAHSIVRNIYCCCFPYYEATICLHRFGSKTNSTE
jgi:hypothetical protein